MIWHAKSLIFRLFSPSFLTYSILEDIPIKMCIKTFKSLTSAPSPTVCVDNGRLTNFTVWATNMYICEKKFTTLEKPTKQYSIGTLTYRLLSGHVTFGFVNINIVYVKLTYL